MDKNDKVVQDIVDAFIYKIENQKRALPEWMRSMKDKYNKDKSQNKEGTKISIAEAVVIALNDYKDECIRLGTNLNTITISTLLDRLITELGFETQHNSTRFLEGSHNQGIKNAFNAALLSLKDEVMQAREDTALVTPALRALGVLGTIGHFFLDALNNAIGADPAGQGAPAADVGGNRGRKRPRTEGEGPAAVPGNTGKQRATGDTRAADATQYKGPARRVALGGKYQAWQASDQKENTINFQKMATQVALADRGGASATLEEQENLAGENTLPGDRDTMLAGLTDAALQGAMDSGVVQRQVAQGPAVG